MRAWRAPRRLLPYVLVGSLVGAAGVEGQSPSSRGEAYIVIVHARGPKWDPEESFRNQSGIRYHIRHYEDLQAEGLLLFGGPFIDDSGGMMILHHTPLDDARELAFGDPAVQDGLLGVKVRRWTRTLEAEDPVLTELDPPDIRPVVELRPGAKWEPQVPFREQPGIGRHIGYYGDLRQRVTVGGYFPDDAGVLMILTPGMSLEQARKIAEEDPAVKAELLQLEVREWLLVFKPPAD